MTCNVIKENWRTAVVVSFLSMSALSRTTNQNPGYAHATPPPL